MGMNWKAETGTGGIDNSVGRSGKGKAGGILTGAVGWNQLRW